MRIAISGAGVAGLISALFLARDGHDVVLLERDATPLPASADEAFTWNRKGAPQVRHPHAFLGRVRNLLRDELPDVRDALLAAGATEVNWHDIAPDTLDDRSPQPGDDDLTLLASRRTTFEWVLRTCALATERVELRDGVRVTSLIVDRSGAIPRVTGVETTHGSVEADFVVDAGGRHSHIRSLLADTGIDLPEESSDVGMVYLSRFYRIRDGATEPDKQAFNGGTLGYAGYGVFRGDNRTFSLTLAVGNDDPELRALIGTARFDDAAALLPAAQPWLATGDPIAEAHMMGGLVNRIRHLVVDDRPLVLGLAIIGDALICTNPLYGRGCSLGGTHASLVARNVRAHHDDLESLALNLHTDVQDEIVPWYRASVAQDETMRLARTADPSIVNPIASIIAEGLIPLTRTDALVNRAFFRMINLIGTPDDVMGDPEISRRVLACYAERDSRPAEAPVGPTRDEMIAALQSAPAPAR